MANLAYLCEKFCAMENELDKFKDLSLRQGDDYRWFLSMTKNERKSYYRYLDNIMAQNGDFVSAFDEEVAENREIGLAEGRAEIIRNMLESGMHPEQISTLTGISIEVITKLKG